MYCMFTTPVLHMCNFCEGQYMMASRVSRLLWRLAVARTFHNNIQHDQPSKIFRRKSWDFLQSIRNRLICWTFKTRAESGFSSFAMFRVLPNGFRKSQIMKYILLLYSVLSPRRWRAIWPTKLNICRFQLYCRKSQSPPFPQKKLGLLAVNKKSIDLLDFKTRAESASVLSRCSAFFQRVSEKPNNEIYVTFVFQYCHLTAEEQFDRPSWISAGFSYTAEIPSLLRSAIWSVILCAVGCFKKTKQPFK